MITRNQKINQLQIFVIIFLCIYSSIQLSGLHLLIKEAKRDAWISVLITTLIYLCWVFCLLLIIRRLNNNNPFGSWLEGKAGKTAARLVLISFATYVLISAYLSLRDVMVFTNVMFLTYTPSFITTLVFIILCTYLAKSGIRSIAICASVLVLNILLLIIIQQILSSINNIDYKLILPVLAEGWTPVMNATVIMGRALTDSIFILFLVHHSKGVSTKNMMIFSIAVCLLILITVIGLIMTFGPVEAAIIRYPYYQLWRVVRLTQYLDHLDFFTLIQTLFAGLIKISLSLFILAEMISYRKWIIYVSAGALFFFTLLPISDMTYLRWLVTYVYPAIVVYIMISTMTILLISFRKRGHNLEN